MSQQMGSGIAGQGEHDVKGREWDCPGGWGVGGGDSCGGTGPKVEP